MTEKTKLVCPKCGKGQARGSTHCNKCGTALFAAPATPAAAGVPGGAAPATPAKEKTAEGGKREYSDTFKKVL
jgi:hypothetical protein